LDGINIDAGIFMSYIGLFSYYNFDNWAYQPSYVSSNTPWFFEGLRVQIFPTPHLRSNRGSSMDGSRMVPPIRGREWRAD